MNETARKIIRGVCIADVLLTLGMTLPGLSALTIGLYTDIHQSLGLGGQFPEFGPMHQLFVNITGMFVFLWSLVRYRLLDRLLVVCDISARCFLASLILYYVFVAGISQVFLTFVATELIGAGLQSWALTKA